MRFLLLLGSLLAGIGVPPASANPYQGIRYEVSEGRVYEHLSGNLSIAASTASWSTYTITLEGESGVVHAETINVKHLTISTMTTTNVVATSGTFSGSLTAGTLIGDGSALTGLATDGELATEISRATARENDLGASTGTIKASLDSVILSTAPLKDYANWNTAYGWGDHAGLYLLAPATFYVVQPTDYLQAPATFQYQAPLTAGVDYLAPDGDGSGLSGVIHSTATGNYLLRVATATYLATAPGACGAGEFINALTADGTKTCATPAGGGDVVLAATQTFTGDNTFTNSVNLNQTYISSTTDGSHPFGGSTLATWYSNPSWSMAITTGTWELSLQASLRINRTVNSIGHMDGQVCLSTSTTAGTGLIDCVTGMWMVPGQSYSIVPISLFLQYVATEAKTIYLHAITRNFSGVTDSADLIEFYSTNERKRTGRLRAVKVRD